MEQSIVELFFTKETIFFGLFLYLFWVQQQEKKDQNSFLLRQQQILADLTTSLEKLTLNQEKLAERIERIEFHVEMNSKQKEEH
jgi:hypothetical protein